MQRITNCILLDPITDQVLLLQKPRRGWWVAPGGKMESGETIRQTVQREFKEETGLNIHHPSLKGVFTILIEEQDRIIDEWMMFTFLATSYEGRQLHESPEGHLQWVPREKIFSLPKAAGDQMYFDHILTHEELLTMKFIYTPEYELISYETDTPPID